MNATRTIPSSPQFEIWQHRCTSACGESCDGEGWYWMETASADSPVGPFSDAMLAAQDFGRAEAGL